MASNSNRIDIHRLRFGNYVPNAIQSIARDPFSHLVAVGRIDGDIEIYNSHSKWHIQCTIPGKRFFKLQQLVWSTSSKEKHRLFGVSLRGFVFEVDLKALTIINIRDSYGGAAWSVCSSTLSTKSEGESEDSATPILCVGCEDGTVKVFQYDSGGLEYVKSLITSNNARVLSVAVCAKPSADPVVCSSVYIGTSAGYIHCVDRNSGKQHYSIMSDIRKDLRTHVWSVLVTSDHTIISGDNRGHVQMWDGNTTVLLSSIHQHTADVLTLCCSEDEQSVFATGLDSRVVCVRRVGGGGGQQWVYSSAHRPHSHDVYSLAMCTQICPTTGEITPVLLSGGVDTKLCLYGVATFGTARPVWIIPIPAVGLASRSESNDGQSFVVMQHKSNLDIWCVTDANAGDSTSTSTGADDAMTPAKKRSKKSATSSTVSTPAPAPVGVDLSDNCSLVVQLFPVAAPKTAGAGGAAAAQVEQDASEHIHCSSISSTGTYVALSKVGATRLYRLVNNGVNGTSRNGKKGYSLESVALPDTIANNLCTDLTFAATTSNAEEEETGFTCTTSKSVVFTCSIKYSLAATGVATSSKVTVLYSANHKAIVDNNAMYQIKRSGTIGADGALTNGKPSATAISAQVSRYMSSLGVPAAFAYGAGATAVSPCGQFYCVCDRLNTCYVYNLINKLKIHWVISDDSMDSRECISNVKFDPCADTSAVRLVILYSTNRAAFFDIQSKRQLDPPWPVFMPPAAKGRGPAEPTYFPAELLSYPAACQGISFVTSKSNVGIYTSGLVLYNQGLVAVIKLQAPEAAMIPLNKYTPFCQKIKSTADNRANFNKQQRLQGKAEEADAQAETEKAPKSTKKKGRTAEQISPAEASAVLSNSSTSTFSLITCYRSLVLVGGTADGSGRLTLLENPWVRVLDQLPDVTNRKVYGT